MSGLGTCPLQILDHANHLRPVLEHDHVAGGRGLIAEPIIKLSLVFLILIQYLHSSSRSPVSSSPSTRCPQSCQHCKWGSSDTFTQDWYFMSKRPSSHRRLIADRPVVGCVIRDFPSILHIWRGCYRRAHSMLEAFVVKVSPLEAQPKLMSHETRLKLWYVGDTAPESKLAIGIGHLWS